MNDKVPMEVRAAVDALGLVDYAWGRAIYTEQEVQWAVKREASENEKQSSTSGVEGKKNKSAFKKGARLLTGRTKEISKSPSSAPGRRSSTRPPPKAKKDKDGVKTDGNAEVAGDLAGSSSVLSPYLISSLFHLIYYSFIIFYN